MTLLTKMLYFRCLQVEQFVQVLVKIPISWRKQVFIQSVPCTGQEQALSLGCYWAKQGNSLNPQSYAESNGAAGRHTGSLAPESGTTLTHPSVFRGRCPECCMFLQAPDDTSVHPGLGTTPLALFCQKIPLLVTSVLTLPQVSSISKRRLLPFLPFVLESLRGSVSRVLSKLKGHQCARNLPYFHSNNKYNNETWQLRD